MTVSLPGNADLSKLKDRARTLRDQVRDRIPAALDLVRTHHPRLPDLTGVDSAGFRLADAQLTLARRYGFASWPRLVSYLHTAAELRRSPHAEPVGQELHNDDERADELLRLACLTYGSDDPTRLPRGRALLAEHPQLASASIHTAAATGQADAAASMLQADPGLVRVQGGPFRWEPLLYLTFSRLPDGDPLATARGLLDAGADPGAGYLWEGLVPPFTALTGVFGAGEGDAPSHAAELRGCCWQPVRTPTIRRPSTTGVSVACAVTTPRSWSCCASSGSDVATVDRGSGGWARHNPPPLSSRPTSWPTPPAAGWRDAPGCCSPTAPTRTAAALTPSSVAAPPTSLPSAADTPRSPSCWARRGRTGPT